MQLRRRGMIVPFLALMLGTSPTAPAQDPPSIVVLLADDAGWADFGFQGGNDFNTPALDRLADRGLVLEACYTTASVCSPSRAGLLTGRHQQRFGHEYNLPGTASRADGGLPLTERTIADRFRAAGYHTGLVGKWHLGLDDRFLPTARGFDEFRGLRAGSRSYFGNPALEDGDRAWERIGPTGRRITPEAEIEYLTDLIATEAIDQIDRHADHPSFLLVSFTAPHTPMHALDSDLSQIDPRLEPKRRRICAAMTLALDRACGAIVDAVDSTGRDTIILFLGDNGGATSNGSDNGPFRGMKGSHFEGGVRVPGIWFRTGDRQDRFRSPVSVLDLDATLLAIAGADVDGLDGIDLRPWFRAERADRPRRLFHWRRGPVATIRDRDLKAIRVEGRGVLLFDLATDPGETRNLAPDRTPDVIRMLASLSAWEESMVDPRWRTADVWRRNLLQKHSMSVIGREAERALP